MRFGLPALAAVLVAAGLAACSEGDGGSASPETEPPAATTRLTTTTDAPTTTIATTTTMTTSTTTTTTAPPTTTTTAVDPSLPTYSEVVAEHWPATELCGPQAGISGGPEVLQLGPFGDEGAVTSIREGFPTGFCPGARYIVAGELILPSGDEFPIGTLLTLDADLNFVAVSSWD